MHVSIERQGLDTLVRAVLGGVTAPSPQQVAMIASHLNLFDEIPFLASQVTLVDFSDFQHYGDYRADVSARYARHF